MTPTFVNMLALKEILKARHPNDKVKVGIKLTYVGTYMIYGQVGNIEFKASFPPKKFYAASVNELADFIELLICKQSELFIIQEGEGR